MSAINKYIGDHLLPSYFTVNDEETYFFSKPNVNGTKLNSKKTQFSRIRTQHTSQITSWNPLRFQYNINLHYGII